MTYGNGSYWTSGWIGTSYYGSGNMTYATYPYEKYLESRRKPRHVIPQDEDLL